ncbi:MAG: glycosyltransferase, partial [Chloroflexota bacterium]
MISVVIPVYNSEATLHELVSRLAAVLPGVADSFEVVLVNDGSHDESWTIIVQFARAHPFVRGLDLERNYGQHNALLAGIRAARGSIIVTMDDDLQHPPEELPGLLAAL